MLVDDDPAILEFAKLALQEFLVDAESLVSKAREKLGQGRYDLLISDVTLPDGSGLELAALAQGMMVRALLVSGHATEATRIEARACGVAEIVGKPFTQEELRGAVLRELQRSREAGAEKRGASRRVLFADDDPQVREPLCEALRRQGFEVFEAATGKEALEQVRARDFDIVLMDLHMPELNGIEATRAIKREKPSLFVAVMTGEATHEEVRRALSLEPGACGVLRKPFQLHEFLVLTRHLLEEGDTYRQEKMAEAAERGSGGVRRAFRAVERLEKKGMAWLREEQVRQWMLIIVASLGMGVASFYFITPLHRAAQNLGESILQFMSDVEGYLYRDEQRELRREKP